jgi:hypothetical protein
MRAYASTALAAECSAVAAAQPGERNARLNRAAYALGQLAAAGELDATAAAAGLAAAAAAAGLGDAEIRSAITSGMRAGAAQPRAAHSDATARHRHPQPRAAQPRAAQPPPQPEQTDAWVATAEPALRAAQAALWGPVGAAALSYARTRGLADDTLRAWGCGAGTAAGRQTLCWGIWATDGRLTAVRHRHLAGTLRYVSTPGSRLAGHLAGSHLLWAERTAPLRTLLVCEGELNGMSCWQAGHPAGLDVVSLGSEGGTVPSWLRTLAGRYGAVLAWLDKPERSAAALDALGGTPGLALHSQTPDGKVDANDLLRAGQLGRRLWDARHLLAQRQGGDAIRRLCWQCWDVAGTLDDTVRAAVRAAALAAAVTLW